MRFFRVFVFCPAQAQGKKNPSPLSPVCGPDPYAGGV